MEIAHITSADQWNDLIRGLPGAHALQTWEWGQVKAEVGWKAHPLLWRDGKWRNLCRRTVPAEDCLAGRFCVQLASVMYVPRGPMLDWSDTDLVQQVLDDLQDFAKSKGAIFLKIDPDLPLGFGVPGEFG